MRRVILTFLLTSLFWWGLFTYYAYNKAEPGASVVDDFVENFAPHLTLSDDVERSSVEQVNTSVKKGSTATPSKQTAPAKHKSATTVKQKSVESAGVATEGAALASQQSGTISQEIIGKWQPVEGAKCPLEITKYGVAIKTEYGIKIRRKYSLNGLDLKIGYEQGRVELIKEGGAVYLDIYNMEEYSGRYKRISQPRKITTTPIDLSEYPTAIVGKWTPIDGQDCPLEITKYGTLIRTEFTLGIRSEYTLSGNKMKIRYDNAIVELSEDANYCYLEIFNTEDFSGRYRKTK